MELNMEYGPEKTVGGLRTGMLSTLGNTPAIPPLIFHA